MSSYRSEANSIANKVNYTDLNLTQYPNVLDTRTNNPNLKGFVNIGEGAPPNYVMAEYINATIDAVMAVEKALGVEPMVPFGTPVGNKTSVIENSTVSQRLTRIENGSIFDVRYGGTGWNGSDVNRPTLSNHRHDGTGGHPGKIHLVTEIEGVLPKKHVDLTLATGITGADLFVGGGNGQKISASLNDKLSVSEGGTIKKDVTVQGKFQSRTYREYDQENAILQSNCLVVSDSTASDGRCIRSNFQSNGAVFDESLDGMLFGKYVISARVKVSSTFSGGMVAMESTGLNGVKYRVDFSGAEFANNTWKTIYLVFDYNRKGQGVWIHKYPMSQHLFVDSVVISPITPAVFNR